ncbi:hypothetical protein D3C72_1951770 [compost metagenome]
MLAYAASACVLLPRAACPRAFQYTHDVSACCAAGMSSMDSMTHFQSILGWRRAARTFQPEL